MPRLGIGYVIAIAAYCACIFAISAQSDPPKPDIGFEIPGLDKLAHAVLFGGLAGLVSVGLRRSNARLRSGVQFYLPLAFTLLYGLSDEIHQLFVPDRTFDLFDLLADGVGGLAIQLVLCGIVWKELPHRARRLSVRTDSES